MIWFLCCSVLLLNYVTANNHDVMQELLARVSALEENQRQYNDMSQTIKQLEERVQKQQRMLQMKESECRCTDKTHVKSEGLQNKAGRKKRVSIDGVIAFTATTSQQLMHIPFERTIVFDSVSTNEGNGYNGSDGIFTAPRSGVYVFMWNLMVAGGWQIHADLNINGQKRMVSGVGPDQGYADASNFMTVKLSAGDRVLIQNNCSKRDCSLHAAHSSFSGFLLFESD